MIFRTKGTCRTRSYEKCTSVALVKTVADNEKAFFVSPELFEVINKLLKLDEDNATGDAQTLCELFLGESSSHRHATERTREIPPNVPFSILHGLNSSSVCCSPIVPHVSRTWPVRSIYLYLPSLFETVYRRNRNRPLVVGER